MTMSVELLAAALESMVPADTELIGIENFTDAWLEYFYESELQIPPAPAVWQVAPGALSGAAEAMQGAMAGVANVNAGAAIGAGITAFWGALALTPAAIWPALPPIATITPPPALGGITAAATAAGVANIAAGASLQEASQTMAAAIHPLNLGGLALDTITPITWGIL